MDTKDLNLRFKSYTLFEAKQESNELLIAGSLMLPRHDEFFIPLTEWIKNFAKPAENKQLNINFKVIIYQNSILNKLYNVVNLLDDLVTNNKTKVTINWYYDESDEEEEDILELGEFIRDKHAKNCTFNFLPTNIEQEVKQHGIVFNT